MALTLSQIGAGNYKVASTPPVGGGSNNNPFNIKYGSATSQYINNGSASIGSAAPDGGYFLKFNNRDAAVSAAQNLLFSSGVYNGLTVDQALKKWSNNAYGGDIVPSLATTSLADLTPEQQTQVLNAMETKGENDATPPGTLTLSGLPAGSYRVSQPGQSSSATPAPSSNWLTDSIKGMITGTGQDFKSLGSLPSALMNPGSPNFWSTIGGSINALSDVGMATGILAGDIASGGADVPLDPAEMAGGIAARDAAEKGIGTVVKKGLQSTVGRFAAGKGVGLAAQGVASGTAAAANIKSKGGTNTQATESGITSAAITMATFGLMNRFGPKVTNGFVNLISKSKAGDVVKTALNSAADYLKSATGMGTLKGVGEGISAKLNAAAEQVAIASYRALGGIASALKTPTTSEAGAMVQRVSSNVAETGNKVVESTFQKALTALSKFTLGAEDVKNVAAQIPSAVSKTASDIEEQIAAEQERLATSGAKINPEDPNFRTQAETNVRQTNTTEALSADASATVLQRSQELLATLTRGGKATVSEIINGLNIKTPEAIEAALTSSWWQAIRDKVGATSEGQAALQAYTDAMTARAQQSEGSTFADTMRHAMAGGWQRVTSSVLSMLKDSGSVANLKAALGRDFPTFQKDLTQKIIGDATLAYQHVIVTANGNITPKVTDEAQKALGAVIDSYLGKIGKLPSLLSAKTIGFLSDMKNGIPTVSTLADNLGIDGSKLLDETGKPLLEQGAQMAQKATQATIDMVRNSPVGKVLTSKSYSRLPQALLSSSKEEIASIKQLLGPDSTEWKTMAAGALGDIMQKVTGLMSPATHDDVEKFLEGISAKVGGDLEKYQLLFGTAEKRGKETTSAFIENLANLANATKKGSTKSAAVKAAASVLGFAIHHPFMGFMLARESLNEFVGKESSDLIKSFASKTPAQIRTMLTSEATGVPGPLLKAISAINQYLSPLLKYEVSQKFGQASGGIFSP